MLRPLVAIAVAIALITGAIYVAVGRGAPPRITIGKPDKVVGQIGALEVTAEAPNGRFTALTVTLEQNGRTTPLFNLSGAAAPGLTQVDRDHVRVTRDIGKRTLPELQAGAARIVVSATRPSFLNLRRLSSTATKDFQVRLDPPRVAVISTHHYVNHGGSEMVVYRATPPDVTSGVRVGDLEYRGFPIDQVRLKPDATSNQRPDATNAQKPDATTDENVAFFALLWDQDLHTPIKVFARDDAGNEATADFIDNVFEKPFKKSRIEIDDRFMDRVVPEILEHAPELKLTAPPAGEMTPAFLKVNGELRRVNAAQIAAFAAKTAPTRLWAGPFVQLGNSQVEARFADQRTYLYKGQEIDHQVHLGFDLAVTTRIPVVAANAGTVLNASWLGIYGNCVVLDHGMGVQSLYGHLSSFDVKPGDTVTRGQTLGRSGMTGLAGGDHLHFTMLVGGRMVTPVEWWDPHWIADRVERKLKEAR